MLLFTENGCDLDHWSQNISGNLGKETCFAYYFANELHRLCWVRTLLLVRYIFFYCHHEMLLHCFFLLAIARLFSWVYLWIRVYYGLISFKLKTFHLTYAIILSSVVVRISCAKAKVRSLNPTYYPLFFFLLLLFFSLFFFVLFAYFIIIIFFLYTVDSR